MQITEKINKVFTTNFGNTPLKARLDDIDGECKELVRFTNMKNLKEETGDLLATVLQLCNENEWNPDELIENTLSKINRRTIQYKSLGRKKKVAILGGAFDPIHNGHIQVAQFVLNVSKTFDEVWIMPCFTHMNNKEMTAPNHRLEMCKLASKVDGRIKVFDYEIKNELGGETYNFVNRLLQEDFAKDEYDFSIIIGQDNANTFDTWVNFEHLERMIRFIVVSRKGYTLVNNAWYLKSPHIYLVSEQDEIEKLSSSMVRYHLKNNEMSNILDKVDESVYKYILDNKLYI